MTIKRVDQKITIKDVVFDGRFEVVYQPLILLKDPLHPVCGLEALIRFPFKSHSTEKIISVIESQNLINKLTIEVIKRIAESFKENPNTPISINVSYSSLNTPNFSNELIRTLIPYSLTINNIIIEITEGQKMTPNSTVINNLKFLRAHGAKIALDDFGTGYSNFESLMHFPVDRIKIDKKFIINSLSSLKSKKIFKSIVGLAKSMDLEVVAEGVETLGSELFVKTEGCDIAQGHHIAKPLRYEHLDTFFKFYKKKREKMLGDTKILTA